MKKRRDVDWQVVTWLAQVVADDGVCLVFDADHGWHLAALGHVLDDVRRLAKHGCQVAGELLDERDADVVRLDGKRGVA